MTIPDSTQQPNGYSGPSLPRPQPQTDYPPSYLQLSDLRTGSKRKRANTTSTTTSLSTPPTAPGDQEIGVHVAQAFDKCIFDDPAAFCNAQDLCVDCVVDCDDADCKVSPTEKCTDQCIVVPCNDQSNCHNVCTEESCRVENCDGGEQCFGILDEPFQLLCCTDYHGSNASSSQINWDRALDDILGMNGCNYGLSGCSQFPSSTSQVTSIPSVPALNNTQNNSSTNFAVTPQDNGRTLSTTTSGSSLATPVEPQLPETQVSQSAPSQNATGEFVCRWLGCNVSFSTLNELVGHVNLTHLRPPSPSSQPSKKLRLDNDTTNSTRDILPLSCHWDDCHLYPDSSALPGPSTGLQPGMAFDLLSSHFFHDHLGLSVPPSQVPSMFQGVGTSSNEASGTASSNSLLNQVQNSGTGAPAQGMEKDSHELHSQTDASPNKNETIQTDKPAEPTYATPAPSPPPDTINPSTLSPHDCSQSTHTCHWRSCELSFPTCAALTEHLAQAHVGSGKGHYDCHWGNCTRNGSHGFASKQKIMRHLQAHTGHRPFVCKECGQHFSEAATLAQHMRRHTQEKPFVCDFPGCGKAFAITGALTIHKRTHNGERPFQCPHCERAFAESSNLSKHLRTHTGDRPYRCPEPGCGKAFARPDQLQRHGNVHAKKRAGSSSSSSSGDNTGGGNTVLEQAKAGEAIEVK